MINNSFNWWVGVVEDVNDPLKIGRLRVRIVGFHSQNKIEVPTEALPWSTCILPITSASVSGVGISPTGIVPGSHVVGFFKDPDSYQDPIVIGSIPGIPEESSKPYEAFNDPNGVYPLEDHLNESDVNRLARNENIEKTIVKTKKDSVEKDITTALKTKTWNEPETEYSSVYPKNKVVSSESGHIIEIDDTPEKERLHTYHKAGTFEEIYPDGKKVTKIVNENYEIVASDENILIKGNKNLNVNQDINIKGSKNLNIEISGDVNLYIGGNSTIETNGNHIHKIKGQTAIISEGNMVLMAPRIDLNPSGFSPDNIQNPFVEIFSGDFGI